MVYGSGAQGNLDFPKNMRNSLTPGEPGSQLGGINYKGNMRGRGSTMADFKQ